MKCAVQVVGALHFARAELDKAGMAALAHDERDAAKAIMVALDATNAAIKMVTDLAIGAVPVVNAHTAETVPTARERQSIPVVRDEPKVVREMPLDHRMPLGELDLDGEDVH